MSGTPPTIEWFIARDGAQHGPVSDVEMRKFVELGHLRAVDLVWCQRFTEWISGAQAFPEHFRPQSQVPPPPGAPHPTAPSAPVAHGLAATPAQAAQHQLLAQPSPALMQQPGAGPIERQTHQLQAPQPSTGVPAPAPRRSDDAHWAEAMRGVVQGQYAAQAFQSGPAPAPAPVASNFGASLAHPSFDVAPHQMQGGPMYGGQQPAGLIPDQEPTLDHTFGRRPGELENDGQNDDLQLRQPRRSWIGMTTVAFAVILITGGLGWFGWQNRAMLSGISGASAIGSVLSVTRSTAPTTDQLRSPPYQTMGDTKELIDGSLQKIAIWRFLKREFAKWYDERVDDIERMRAQKRDERVITQFMVDVVVTLRRRYAQTALQASPEHLRAMSTAFVANLKQLGSRDGATCYAFITHGESSPFMIELSRTAAFAESLQRQMLAVFEAIVDARASKKVHPNTRRQDYERLTGDLEKRGWTQQDLATFSDPDKLSRSLPDKVCSLVQEWFVAQLAIKETDLQIRLLAESLKPLVGG